MENYGTESIVDHYANRYIIAACNHLARIYILPGAVKKMCKNLFSRTNKRFSSRIYFWGVWSVVVLHQSGRTNTAVGDKLKKKPYGFEEAE